MQGRTRAAGAAALLLALALPAAARAEPAPGGPGSATPTSCQDGGAPPLPPLPADLPPAVRAYLEALQRHVQDLEARLRAQQAGPAPAGSPPAAGGPPAGTRDAPAPAVLGPRGSRLQIGGFVQTRITNLANAAGDRNPDSQIDFQVTKFRPRFIYTLDPHWEADLQINATTRSLSGATSVTARDAYAEYHNAAYQMRLGQQKITYGFEDFAESDEERAALERARVFNVLFPDERDVGFSVGTKPANPRAARFAAGVFNGTGINQPDNDSDKNVAATGRIPIGAHHTIGVSAYSGTTRTTGTKDRSRPSSKRSAWIMRVSTGGSRPRSRCCSGSTWVTR